jgi:hypothetical protein
MNILAYKNQYKMRAHNSKLFLLFILVSFLTLCCTSPLIETRPEIPTDKSNVTITCNANQGNKGLLNFSGPVYVHLGLITDSSIHTNDWRYVKFKWGSTENAALATPVGNNSWSYNIPNVREFFQVSDNEKILELVVLFRQGNCIDTACKTLRNADKSDMHIPLKQSQTSK